jgi:hypothetical protein
LREENEKLKRQRDELLEVAKYVVDNVTPGFGQSTLFFMAEAAIAKVEENTENK